MQITNLKYVCKIVSEIQTVTYKIDLVINIINKYTVGTESEVLMSASYYD